MNCPDLIFDYNYVVSKMPDLRSQKTVAARIMKCGESRVWMDPSRSADIADAITAGDVRGLINDGVIRALPKKGLSKSRKVLRAAQKKKGRRKGHGSHKGAAGTRLRRKDAWMSRIRAIRSLLRQLKAEGRVDNRTYRTVYIKSKSGFFRSRSHVLIYLERNNLLKGNKAESGAVVQGAAKKK
jgi:large subunit ribosomal protein L19e